VRYYVDKLSFAASIKVPSRTNLNEEEQQQGAEGTERRRLQLSFSVLF
jgi:hypothetical protein